MRLLDRILVGVFAVSTLSAGARAQHSPPPDEPSGREHPRESQPRECITCHSKNGEADSAPSESLARSVHADLDCQDCHMNTARPVSGSPSPPYCLAANRIGCAECHEDVAEIYIRHGRLSIGKDPDTPTCRDCHGHHDILAVSNASSRVHRLNLPETCQTCHVDLDLVKRHFSLRDAPIRMYSRSVHGRPTKKGRYTSATCTNCHAASAGGTKTSHRILSASDPESTTYHFSIPNTCGVCHEAVTKDYWEGIHGQYVLNGATDAPVCTHCHGEHGIISPDDPLSPVSAARLAQSTCTPCHDSAVLNQKYGLSGGELASYIDSYHGLKSTAGDVRVANCASCHGSHRILPSTDANSSIHAQNLQETCGECHRNITEQLAQTPIHQPGDTLHATWPGFFRKLYIVLIVGTIGLMILHNGADWLSHVRAMSRAPFVQRLAPGEVAQHWALLISFSTLVITGFSLRFAEAGWVKFLFGWNGGFEMRGQIHRAAAILITFVSIWHCLFALTTKGRARIKTLMFNLSDLRHVGQNISYYAGFRTEPARYGQFSYVEKSEYWALIWGTLVMTVTGVLLWFDNYFVSAWSAPRVLLDVALVIHYYEAWLAFLAIVVWHMYGTMFNPAVYPMNPAWLSGKMPKYMYKDEHPEGPKLQARMVEVRLDEDKPPTASKPAMGEHPPTVVAKP